MWCSSIGDLTIKTYPPPPYVISNWFLSEYDLNGKPTLHTGLDIGPSTLAVNQPIRAIADGYVVYSAYLSTSTWLGMVVIRHEWNGHKVYARYAHMRPPEVHINDIVLTGDVIGNITPTTGTIAKFPPHHHFDLSALDDTLLETNPTNWPGYNEFYIRQHYQDPLPFMKARLAENDGTIPEEPMAITFSQYKNVHGVVNVRRLPTTDNAKGTVIGSTALNTVVNVVNEVSPVTMDGYEWRELSTGGWTVVKPVDGAAWFVPFP